MSHFTNKSRSALQIKINDTVRMLESTRFWQKAGAGALVALALETLALWFWCLQRAKKTGEEEDGLEMPAR